MPEQYQTAQIQVDRFNEIDFRFSTLTGALDALETMIETTDQSGISLPNLARMIGMMMHFAVETHALVNSALVDPATGRVKV